LLIMDNPFIGLDAPTRSQLTELLSTLVKRTNLQVILVLSKTDSIPDFITHIVSVKDMTVSEKMTRDFFIAHQPVIPDHVLDERRSQMLKSISKDGDVNLSSEIVRLNDVSITYGERTILKKLKWLVHCGEHWALKGPNGSGKSTLLSLICADNPQSYSCDIELFGNKRGSGESIWDIKKHIGYVSPEMHRAYLKDLPAIDIVASGLSDSIGLYMHPKSNQIETCEHWMDIFGILEKKDCTFLKLSSGEQRLCLLARAFVKSPDLLILDEPLHGLDLYNRRMVKDIIETFCECRTKTLIMVTHYEEELPSNIDHSLVLVKQGDNGILSNSHKTS
jgi:molybdate transport system ATP-binding protein